VRSERSGEGESSLHGGVLGASAEAVGSSELVALAPALRLSQAGADLRASQGLGLREHLVVLLSRGGGAR